MPPSYDTAKMLRADLAHARAAGEAGQNAPAVKERVNSGFLADVDDAGRVADFHALRHTFISNLARGGVHPKLARHSTITLTMDRCSHAVLGNYATALDVLPDLGNVNDAPRRANSRNWDLVRARPPP